MRSLRQRLGVTITLGAFVLTAAAGFAIVYERWQEAIAALPAAIELEAFRLAESTGLSLGDLPGDDPFAVMIGTEGQELATVGEEAKPRVEVREPVLAAQGEDVLARGGYVDRIRQGGVDFVKNEERCRLVAVTHTTRKPYTHRDLNTNVLTLYRYWRQYTTITSTFCDESTHARV